MSILVEKILKESNGTIDLKLFWERLAYYKRRGILAGDLNNPKSKNTNQTDKDYWRQIVDDFKSIGIERFKNYCEKVKTMHLKKDPTKTFWDVYKEYFWAIERQFELDDAEIEKKKQDAVAQEKKSKAVSSGDYNNLVSSLQGVVQPVIEQWITDYRSNNPKLNDEWASGYLEHELYKIEVLVDRLFNLKHELSNFSISKMKPGRNGAEFTINCKDETGGNVEINTRTIVAGGAVQKRHYRWLMTVHFLSTGEVQTIESK
jgi:hypothetical protein